MKNLSYFITSSLFCLNLLCQSSLASEKNRLEIKEEISGNGKALIEIETAEEDFFFPKNSETYEPQFVKGYNSSYKRNYKENEITNSINEYSKLFKKCFAREVDEKKINSTDKSILLNETASKFSRDFLSYTKEFIKFLEKLEKKERHNTDFQKIILEKDNIELLSNFVSYFEEHFTKAKTETSINLEPDYKKVMVDYFIPFQKLFNAYMYFYNKAFPGKLEFIGYLTDWMPNFFAYTNDLGSVKQKIGYTRDKNGFLLFRLYPTIKVDDSYYYTYIPHGDVDPENGLSKMDHFVERSIFMKKTDDKFDIILKSGILLSQTEESISYTPFTGNHGIPFCKLKRIMISRDKKHTTNDALVSFLEKEKNNPSTKNKQQIENLLNFAEEKKIYDLKNTSDDLLLSSEKKPHTTFFPKINFNPIDSINSFTFIKNILGNQKHAFIEIPSTKVEKQEATYEYFLSLKDAVLNSQVNEERIQAIEWAAQLFETTDEKELIEHIDLSLNEIEKDLHEAYFDEGKKEMEEKIRKEQEERSKMVINRDHYKKDTKPVKEKRSKGKNFFQKKQPQNEMEKKDTGLSEEKIKEIKKECQERINKLKKSGPLKWKSYLGLVNKTIQVLKDSNVNVKLLLNKSSHGFISIEGTKQPICFSHETGEIGTSSAVKDITKLTNTVLNFLTKKKE